MKMRKTKPVTVRDMARRRGLTIHKAKRGGWYIMAGPLYILYCTHEWEKVKAFVMSTPILIKRNEE